MDKKEFLTKYAVERRGSECMKWDELAEKFGRDDLISMWIADMDFKTSEHIVEAIKARADHGAFGYTMVPDSYYEALSNWMQQRHGIAIDRDWVRFSTGCVTGIAWAIDCFTKPGDACMILTPVYYPFHNVVTNNNRKLVKVELSYDNGRYEMDFDAIERAIVENDVKLFIQCSPENPSGRVWTEEELDRVLAICAAHDVLVVSDEIHGDITLDGHEFVPSLRVKGGAYADRLIVLHAASKTFNLASLAHSHIIIADEALRKRFDTWASGMNRTEVNSLSLAATEAGYRHGGEWLDCVLGIVEDNFHYVRDTLARELPEVTVVPLEGTYLAYLDLAPYVGADELHDFVVNECHLAVDYGDQFGDRCPSFIRLNLATTPELVEKAVGNLVTAVKARG